MANILDMSDALERRAPSILMLTTDRQIDRRTLQQADSLIRDGWNVKILAMPQDEDKHKDAPYVIRIKMEGRALNMNTFSLLFFYQRIRRYLPVNGFLIKALRHVAWAYFAKPEKVYGDLFSDALKHHNPAIVMAIDLPTLAVAAKHANLCGAKLVYDSHELYSEQEFSRKERKLWQRIEKKFIHQCHFIITVNPSIASELKTRYSLNAVQVIYNAVNPQSKMLHEKLFHRLFQLPLHRSILLFQGGLSKGRHLETLIRSVKHIKNQEIVLVVLGDGQFKKILERLVLTLKIKDRVYFHPAVPQEELLTYSQAADAGIIPYQAICLNNYYCTPNKLFEFIAAGIPVLGSNLPEINHIVHNNQIGLTGDMNNARQLALLIDEFFSDQDRLEMWKKNSLKAQLHFSWEHEEKKLLPIFRDLIR